MSATIDRAADAYADPEAHFAALAADLAEMVGGPIVKYDEGEPRDEAGKWTDGATGGADPRGMADWRAWARTWSDDERGSIERYQQGGYGPINRALRGRTVEGEGDGDSLYGKTVEHYISNLDEAIAKAPPLPREATVYRKVVFDPEDKAENPSRKFYDALAKPGARFRDNAYTSTSADEPTVARWAADLRGLGAEARVVEIHVPKGTHAGYLGDVGHEAFKDERELLLPRGGVFKVRSATPERSVVDYMPPKMAHP